MNADKYIKKWLDGTLSESEKAEFEQSKEHKFLSRLDDALHKFKAPEFNVDAELQRQLDHLPEKKAKQVQISGWPSVFMKVAAAIIFLSGLTYVYLYQSAITSSSEVISYSDEQQKEIRLPDYSSVLLNADSEISYDKGTWENQRNVSLRGEAFFKVQKGEKFSVITESGEVSVLGTQFNVKSRSNFFEVSCFEGKVSVSHQSEQIVLIAGQQMQVFNGDLVQKEIKAGTLPSWLNGKSEFESVPLREVFAELERQFEISISYGDDTLNPDRLFTGAFSHRNLDSALKSVTIPLNLSFKKSGNTITLTKN